jgi:manganese/iron transport system substrate-binding protein
MAPTARRWVVLVAAATSLGGCAAPPAASRSTSRLAVVATTTQVADFARNVGGDKIALTQILRPNVDPHDYEPSPADLVAIGSAQLLVKNGVGLEKWLDQTVTAAGYRGPVVDASTGVAVRTGGEEDPTGDPHIWQNPRNAKTMVANIAAGLSAADPTDSAYFQRNSAAYQARLDELDATIETAIASIPAGQRKLVTNHDAFGYYVDRYHLQFVGSIIPSFDTSAELSGAQINALVAKIKASGVKAIFSESSLPPKTAQAIAAEAGVTVEAGEDSLYADSLGPPGSAGATYLQAMTHNTDVIVAALT